MLKKTENIHIIPQGEHDWRPCQQLWVLCPTSWGPIYILNPLIMYRTWLIKKVQQADGLIDLILFRDILESWWLRMEIQNVSSCGRKHKACRAPAPALLFPAFVSAAVTYISFSFSSPPASFSPPAFSSISFPSVSCLFPRPAASRRECWDTRLHLRCSPPFLHALWVGQR